MVQQLLPDIKIQKILKQKLLTHSAKTQQQMIDACFHSR